MHEEVLPPDAELMESMRAIGYSLKTAVADLVDNSVAAEAKSVRLSWALEPVPSVYLVDNGNGMSEDDLRTAMKLAGKSPLSSRKPSDLGRFGLGLKTASLSQARSLSVVSKISEELTAAQWDLDYLRESGKWTLRWLSHDEASQLPGAEELANLSSGTLVVWQKLDQISAGGPNEESILAEKFDEVSNHLGLVFHRLLAGPKPRLSIEVNGKSVPTYDPFLEGDSGVIDKGVTTINVENSVVSIRPFILPNLNKMTRHQKEKAIFDDSKLREAQGFYVYRNERLLTWGTWFRVVPMGEAGRLARVRVDTSNDLDSEWQLGIMKSRVQPPRQLLDALKRLVPSIIDYSSRATVSKPRAQANPEGQLWTIRPLDDGAFRLEVNDEHPLLEKLESYLEPEGQRALSAYLHALGSFMPAERLHQLLAGDKAIKEGFSSDEEVWAFGQILSEQFRDQAAGDPSLLWSLVENVEPFKSDISLISRLRSLRKERESK